MLTIYIPRFFAGTSYANLASARDAIKQQSCVEEVAFHSPIYSIVSNFKNFSHTYYVDDSNEFRFVVTMMPGDYTLSDMLNIPLVEGRMFAEDEIEQGKNLPISKVLINETFKKMMGLNESPVGKIFRLGYDDYGDISPQSYEIIGVLKDFYIGRGELKPVMIENYNHNPDMPMEKYGTHIFVWDIGWTPKILRRTAITAAIPLSCMVGREGTGCSWIK